MRGSPWSIRVKLTVSYLAAMLLVLAVYATAIFMVVERSASKVLDDGLRSDFSWAAEMWEQRPDGTLTWFEGEPGDPSAPWLQVWEPNGRLLHRTTHADWYPIEESARLASAADGRIVAVPTRDRVFRVLSTRSKLGGQPVVIQVARSEATMQQDRRELALVLILGFPLAAVAACVGGYWLARWALAPIDRMTARARSITAQQLHDRLPVENERDELGRLASVVNDMLERLESSFGQMRRFTSDVSHELRTPLMAMRTVGEVGLRDQRDPRAYREIIGSMLEEGDRLTCLVERLLALSRAESGATEPSLDIVDLGEVAADVTSQLDVLAEEKHQTLVVDQRAPTVGIADPFLLRQAVTNLVDNAIKYSPEGSHLQIRVWAAAGRCGLDIQDDGPGIEPERRARIFDRFYRGTVPEGEGSGLGLAIARRAIEAMGGHLTLEPASARGSVFRITLPEATTGASRPPKGAMTGTTVQGVTASHRL